MKYYEEVKNDILNAMEDYHIREVLENYTSEEAVYDKVYELIDNYVTGNIDGSYYCSRYKARVQTYNHSSEVIEALEEYGYTEYLKNFKLFVILADEKYINVENMTLNDNYLEFEEVRDLDFEVLDVITRSYYLSNLLYEILEKDFQ